MFSFIVKLSKIKFFKNLHHFPGLILCITYLFRNDKKVLGIILGNKCRHFNSWYNEGVVMSVKSSHIVNNALSFIRELCQYYN